MNWNLVNNGPSSRGYHILDSLNLGEYYNCSLNIVVSLVVVIVVV